jgi:hypothetical protein
VELAIGTVENRNIIVPLDHVPRYIEENPNKEIYRSYYFYDYSRLAHTEDGNDAKSYSGNRYCRDIHLDIDGSDSLGKVRETITNLVKLNVSPEFIRVYYSGSKGFHVWLPDMFGFTGPEECKRTLINLFPELDPMPLAKNGLIRLPGTLNAKSGLYKAYIATELVYDFDVGEIRDLAKERQLHSQAFLEAILIQWETEYGSYPLSDLKIKEEKPRPKASTRTKRTGYFGCLNSMYDSYPADGFRHKLGLRMTSILMGPLKRSRAMTMDILDSWVRDNPPEKAKVYSEKLTGWAEGIINAEGNLRHHDCENDPVMKEHCVGESCPIYKFRNKQIKPVSMKGALAKYKADIETDHGGFNLNEIYPGVNYSFRKRDIALLAGDTKIGKSTIFNNWAVAVDHLKWLFITPEMDVQQMFERTVQIKKGLRVDDKEGVNEVKDLVISLNGTSDKLLEEIGHIHWMTSSMQTNHIRNLIIQEDPDVVVIDPYESISDVLDNPEHVPNVLRDMANRLDIMFLLIHHINKSGQKELGLHNKVSTWMLKGHKRIQEQCNHLIGFSGSQDSPIRHVYTMATRRNQDFDIYLKGDPATFRFELAKI